MLTSCPPDWSDIATRARCEDGSPSLRDPVATMPVTSHRTGLTYRNAHCAVCHGDIYPNSTDVWKPRIECPSLMQSLTPNLTSADISHALTFEPSQNSWVLRLPSHKSTKSYSCILDPVLPDTSEHIVRRCPTGIIRTCALNWTNADVRNRCEAYTALVFHQNDGYRNAHCAICNNVPVQNLACVRASSRVSVYGKEFSPKAFAVLFDLSGDSGNIVGKERACSDMDQLYDPFFRRCRDVVCSQEGQNYIEGHCISVLPALDSAEDYPANSGRYRNDSAALSDKSKSEYFLNCPKFLLDPDEYELLDDGTVNVPAYHRAYPPDLFHIRSDGRLEICTDEGVEYVDKFKPSMSYVTMAGLGVSITFLLLHLTAFTLLPELRNLSGKNLASLCVSLLAAYTVFIVGQFLEVRISILSLTVTF